MTDNQKLNQQVGLRIRKLREGACYSREVLAEAAGISPSFLSDIETGRKGMTVMTLKNISAALHTSTDFIVNGNSSCPHVPESTTQDNPPARSLSRLEQYYLNEIIRIYKCALDVSDRGSGPDNLS